MSFGIHQQHSIGRIKFAQVFCNSPLFCAFRFSVLGRVDGSVVWLRFHPLHMQVNFVSWMHAFRKRLQVFARKPVSACYARIDVVALLEVDVLEEIATHLSRGKGIAVHFDSSQARDRALYRHQSLAEVLVDCRSR